MKRFIAIVAFLLPLAAWAGREEGIEAYTVGDYPKALAEFQALADAGDIEGQYFVGLFYRNGYGVKREESYPARLEAALRARGVNAKRRGGGREQNNFEKKMSGLDLGGHFGVK